MDINRESADRLCKQLLEGIVRWPAVDAALQAGGFEDKARGRFEKAIVRWLKTDHPNEHFIVLPEYARSEKTQRGKSIDFSLIQPEPSTAAPTRYLSVKALFCKQASGLDADRRRKSLILHGRYLGTWSELHAGSHPGPCTD